MAGELFLWRVHRNDREVLLWRVSCSYGGYTGMTVRCCYGGFTKILYCRDTQSTSHSASMPCVHQLYCTIEIRSLHLTRLPCPVYTSCTVLQRYVVYISLGFQVLCTPAVLYCRDTQSTSHSASMSCVHQLYCTVEIRSLHLTRLPCPVYTSCTVLQRYVVYISLGFQVLCTPAVLYCRDTQSTSHSASMPCVHQLYCTVEIRSLHLTRLPCPVYTSCTVLQRYVVYISLGFQVLCTPAVLYCRDTQSTSHSASMSCVHQLYCTVEIRSLHLTRLPSPVYTSCTVLQRYVVYISLGFHALCTPAVLYCRDTQSTSHSASKPCVHQLYCTVEIRSLHLTRLPSPVYTSCTVLQRYVVYISLGFQALCTSAVLYLIKSTQTITIVSRPERCVHTTKQKMDRIQFVLTQLQLKNTLLITLSEN